MRSLQEEGPTDVLSFPQWRGDDSSGGARIEAGKAGDYLGDIASLRRQRGVTQKKRAENFSNELQVLIFMVSCPLGRR